MFGASAQSRPYRIPGLRTTSTNGPVSPWPQRGYDRGLIISPRPSPPSPHPGLFRRAFKKLTQFHTKWFTAAWCALKFHSVFLLTSVDCLRRDGILEGCQSARGPVAMVTNPWAGFHLTGRKLNYLQTERNKLKYRLLNEVKMCLIFILPFSCNDIGKNLSPALAAACLRKSQLHWSFHWNHFFFLILSSYYIKWNIVLDVNQSHHSLRTSVISVWFVIST